MNWIAFSLVVGLFVCLMIIFSQEEMDYVTYALFFAAISVLVITFFYGLSFEEIIGFIEFKPLIFIFSMQIMISIAERYQIFHWVAVKTLQVTKGNHRVFFYLICIVSTLMAAFIADLTVTIIFIPLVIRACKILNIKPAPYLYAITITINIGSILTTFSSSENVIMADAFALDNIWFFKNVVLICMVMLIASLILLDYTDLRKIEPRADRRKRILMDIMTPDIVVIDNKKLIVNSIFLFTILIGLIFIPQTYFVALIGALLMSLLNRIKVTESIKRIDWHLILFILSLFLIIGSMEVIGIFHAISSSLTEVAGASLVLTAIIVLLMSSVLSGLLSNTPTMIAFISIILNLYGTMPPDIILIALVAGVHLGGNLTPQGSACDIMTLSIAHKFNIENVNYKGLFKKGGLLALMHLAIMIVFIVLYSVIFP